MKTINFEQFKALKPCWLDDDELMQKAEAYSKLKPNWTALDILNLTEVLAEHRLWLVLHEELIEAKVLYEFTCKCAENALKLIENPDKRSIDGIRIKRAWLKGEATDEELETAYRAAYAAADAARDAAYYAARAAARAAAYAAAYWAAYWAACAAARAEQIEMLKRLLTEDKT